MLVDMRRDAYTEKSTKDLTRLNQRLKGPQIQKQFDESREISEHQQVESSDNDTESSEFQSEVTGQTPIVDIQTPRKKAKKGSDCPCNEM